MAGRIDAEAVVAALARGINQAIDRRVERFAPKLQAWLGDMLDGPAPDDWRAQLDQFVAETKEMGLEITPDSIRAIEHRVKSRSASTNGLARLGPAERMSGQVAERAPYVVTVVPDVSGPPEPSGAGGVPPKPAKPAEDAGGGAAMPATKQHLPADRRGAWIEGTKGDGVFQYADTPENRKAGLANQMVRFKGGYIGLGGLPAEAYYGGSAAAASVEIPDVKATEADNIAADRAMRQKLGDPNWDAPRATGGTTPAPQDQRSLSWSTKIPTGRLPTRGPRHRFVPPVGPWRSRTSISR